MRKIFLLTLLVLAVILISGCSQGDQQQPQQTYRSSSATGRLVLQITDAPAVLGIEKAEVTISKVQVHMAETEDNETAMEASNSTGTNATVTAKNESSWITVVEGSVTYDLLAIKDVKEFLGSAELKTGKYTQIRLNVDKAVVTINGTQENLTIPSKTIKLVNEFDIVANQTTTLTLDFDAEKSISLTGSGKYMMKPTIKVIEE